MSQMIMAEKMRNLTCDILSLPQRESLQGEYEDKECILHLAAGKGILTIGGEWKYPLDAYDTVWIPAGTVFLLQNDGIGNLEVSRYCYSV